MRVLLIRNSPSIYTHELAFYLNQEGISTDIYYCNPQLFIPHVQANDPIMTTSKSTKFKPARNLKFLWHTKKSRSFLSQLAPYYDICNLHYVHWDHIFIINKLKQIARRIVVSVWGSDFYKSTARKKLFQKYIYQNADCITFGNEETRDKFKRENAYINDKQMHICRFGLSNFESIKQQTKKAKQDIRQKFCNDPNKTIVTCSVGVSPVHNQDQIIHELVKSPADRLNPFFFLFPMTYGEKEHKENNLKLLKNARFSYKALQSFMSSEDIAALRLASDIFIHIPSSDQLSGTLQEHFYSNSLCITADWLPYSIFDKHNLYRINISNQNQIFKTLLKLQANIKEYKKKTMHNKKIIYNLSSWQAAIPLWKKCYNTILSTSKPE